MPNHSQRRWLLQRRRIGRRRIIRKEASFEKWKWGKHKGKNDGGADEEALKGKVLPYQEITIIEGRGREMDGEVNANRNKKRRKEKKKTRKSWTMENRENDVRKHTSAASFNPPSGDDDDDDDDDKPFQKYVTNEENEEENREAEKPRSTLTEHQNAHVQMFKDIQITKMKKKNMKRKMDEDEPTSLATSQYDNKPSQEELGSSNVTVYPAETTTNHIDEPVSSVISSNHVNSDDTVLECTDTCEKQQACENLFPLVGATESQSVAVRKVCPLNSSIIKSEDKNNVNAVGNEKLDGGEEKQSTVAVAAKGRRRISSEHKIYGKDKSSQPKLRVVSTYFNSSIRKEVGESEEKGVRHGSAGGYIVLPKQAPSVKAVKKPKLEPNVRVVSGYFNSAIGKQEMKREEKNGTPEGSIEYVVLPKQALRAKIGNKSAQKPPGLFASQRRDEAYKRKTLDNMWKPPRSEFRLLQEDYAHDPWKVLIICMLLNLTTGRQVARVVANLFSLCPNAKAATDVPTENIEEVIKSLGLHRKRAIMIQRFSQEYMGESWTHVTELHGIGKDVVSCQPH